MASIYTQADSNTRKTWFLLTGFLVFIVALGWLFGYLLNSDAILYFAVFLSVFMSFGSYWWSDKIVLSMYKAVPIEHNKNPELYHVVENLCITAGLPVPKIYIIPEMQPNAFATGRDKNHAVVCVTQGLLNRLDKTELQGVLAHELSHIGNKDMLLSTVVAVLAGVVAMLANMFMRISFWGGGKRSSNDDNGNAGAILMVLGIVAAILAPVAATLVQLAISRKREFVADASAVKFIRSPTGLIGALQKIKSNSDMKVSGAVAPLFLAKPSKAINLFETHPPLDVRIDKLSKM